VSRRLLALRLARVLAPADGAAAAVQAPLRAALSSRLALRDALDGTWLGTPLHPALTDVPVGAATTAFLLDLGQSVSGSGNLAVAADRALAVSVLGALPAAATGTSDWRDLRGDSRRAGVLHGLLNVAGLALNCWSLALRAGGRRGTAKLVSGAAFAVQGVAAHVGGELSFGLGVRVNRTAWEGGGAEFAVALDASEVEGDAMRRVEVDGVPVLVARSREGRVCAIAATCSHLGGPLDEGDRDGDVVICPWHGSHFDLCSGEVVHGPAVFPQPRYEAREQDGRIELRRVSD
jgi:nitrite reductase/ring-hydroxylating ferredoxin subunit/uncharacterized membrane protein